MNADDVEDLEVTTGNIHHQRGRVAAHEFTQSDQDPGIVPESGRSAEATIFGAGAHR